MKASDCPPAGSLWFISRPFKLAPTMVGAGKGEFVLVLGSEPRSDAGDRQSYNNVWMVGSKSGLFRWNVEWWNDLAGFQTSLVYVSLKRLA